MINREIKFIDHEEVIAKIHANMDESHNQLMLSIESAKSALCVDEHVPTHEEIELETEVAKSTLDNWSIAIAIQPFMLAFMSFYFG